MWTGHTTRTPLTAIITERTASGAFSTPPNVHQTYQVTRRGTTSNGGQATEVYTNRGTTSTDDAFSGFYSFGDTGGGTTDASGGQSFSWTSHFSSRVGTDHTASGDASNGDSPGAATETTLTTGTTTSSRTDYPGVVSTTYSEGYTYPRSTLAAGVLTTTETSSTHAQTTWKTGSVNHTWVTAKTVGLTCSSFFEIVGTAFWLDDDERGWIYTGGAGLRALQQICEETSVSFASTDTTTSRARVLAAADPADTFAIDLIGVSAGTVTASWTDFQSADITATLISFDSLPNSTETAAVTTSRGTTTMLTAELATGVFSITATVAANATETYVIAVNMPGTTTARIPALDGNGDVIGFTTRSVGTTFFSTTVGTSAAPYASSSTGAGFAEGEGISETVIDPVEWTGFQGVGLGGVSAWMPRVPDGVRVFASTQQLSIYAQVAAGLGFTVPAPGVFSLFQRFGVFSPLPASYTTTDVSAGNTRSYLVSLDGNSLYATRATVPTTSTTDSGVLSNSHILSHRWRESEAGGDSSSSASPAWLLGGRQHDTRSEIAALDAGISDYTTIEATNCASSTASSPTLTSAYPITALRAFHRLPGYSSIGRGALYATTPKWIE